MTMQTILHVMDHSLPVQDGYSFRSLNILKSQKKTGLAPVAITSPRHEASLGNSVAPIGHEHIEGLFFYRSGKLSWNAPPILREVSTMRLLHRRLHQVMDTERPNLLHVHSPVLNVLPALFAARKRNVPVAYEIRAFWEDAGVDQGTYKEWGVKYRLVRWLETLACQKVDQIFTICEGLKSDLVKRGISAHKIQVVPNAIVPEDFTPQAKNRSLAEKWGVTNKFVFGFIGSFYHYEGLDVFVQAAARLAGTGLAFKLLLIGGGEQKEALERQVRDAGLSDRIIFTGRVPHDQVPDMYSLLDVLVLPRKRIRLTETVTPLKPLEAMAMKKAIVASDVGGHREMIQDGVTGLLYKAEEVNSLVNSLLELAENETKREVLAKSGYDWVTQQRTWEKNAQIYRQVYARMIE